VRLDSHLEGDACQKRNEVDSLVVVAGGDCHNALVDGQKAAMSGIPTHFFFYPFDGDPQYLELQLHRLSSVSWRH